MLWFKRDLCETVGHDWVVTNDECRCVQGNLERKLGPDPYARWSAFCMYCETEHPEFCENCRWKPVHRTLLKIVK